MKEWLIVREGNKHPEELNYQIYYRGDNQNNIVKEEEFRNQLKYYNTAFNDGDETIALNIDRITYNRTPVLSVIRKIDGLQKDAVTEQKYRFHFGAAAGYQIASLYKETNFNTDGNPLFGVVVDAVPDRFDNKLFFRGELQFFKTRFEGTCTYNDNSVPRTYTRYRAYGRPTANLLISANLNIVNSEVWRIFAGIIAGGSWEIKTSFFDETSYTIGGQVHYSHRENKKITGANLPVGAQVGFKIGTRLSVQGFYTRQIVSHAPETDSNGASVALFLK